MLSSCKIAPSLSLKLAQTFGKRGLHIDADGGRTSSPGVVASVYGSSGFLARNIINKLCSVGIQMVVPYRGEQYNIKHLKPMGDIGQIAPQLWDIRDPDSIYDSLKHSNLVINTVSQVDHTRNFTLESVNVDGARLIAKIAREAGVERFIHISTAQFDPESESEWIRTKSLGELAVREVFPSATIVRPTILFGHEDIFIRRIAELARMSPIFPMYKPDRIIQPVHVDDVASAILQIAANDSTSGKVYELGGAETWTNREFYDYMLEITYNKPYKLENCELFVSLWAKLASKIHRLPRWTPTTLDVMKTDAVVSPDALSFEDLGISMDDLVSLRRFAISVARMYRVYFRYDNLVADSWVHPASYKGHLHHTNMNSELDTLDIKRATGAIYANHGKSKPKL